MRALILPTLLVAAAVLAACGSTDDPTTTPTVAASPTPSAAGAGKPPPTTLSDACFEGMPGTVTGIAVGADSQVRVATIGTGRTAVVLLPQASGGMCGWVPYAVWAAKQGKLTALLLDPCGVGRSVCTDAVRADPESVVKSVVEHARGTLGAERVVVGGASAGGSTALATAQGAGADAVVDLSGPAQWEQLPDATVSAEGTRIPLLIVAADADKDIRPDVLRKAVAASPASIKHYLRAPDGHGWSMLTSGQIVDPEITEVGRQVLAWITGDYAKVTG